MYDRARHLYLKLLLAATFVLIAAGGLVTSTGSGLSVPDWPLSYGQYFPPMVGGIRYEHTHRVIAGTVGLLTLVYTLWSLVVERRVWMRRLALLAFASVVAQAILGGLTVLYLLPLPVSVTHACLGQSFFALLALLALFSSREWTQTRPAHSDDLGSLGRLFAITTGFVFAQLVLGAYVRHSGGSGVVPHIVVGLLVALHALLLLLRSGKSPSVSAAFQGPCLVIGALVLGQVFLGFGAFAYKYLMPAQQAARPAEVLLATAHQTNGALILAVLAYQTARCLRLCSPR